MDPSWDGKLMGIGVPLFGHDNGVFLWMTLLMTNQINSLALVESGKKSTEFSGSCKKWQVAYNHPIGSIYHLYTRYI